VALLESGDRLHVYRFNLDDELRRSRKDYLFAASVAPATAQVGARFQYQIEGKSSRGGLKYRLESGPSGLSVSRTGLVEWPLVAGTVDADAVVIIALGDDSQREVFHTFRIRITAGVEGKFQPSSILQLPVAKPGALTPIGIPMLPIPIATPSGTAEKPASSKPNAGPNP
jgi:hypothetical protein